MLRSVLRNSSLLKVAARTNLPSSAAYSASAIPEPVTAPDIPYTGVSINMIVLYKSNLFNIGCTVVSVRCLPIMVTHVIENILCLTAGYLKICNSTSALKLSLFRTLQSLLA